MEQLASEWLRGVRTGDYDLVAIGVQECTYKPKRRAISQSEAYASRSGHHEDGDEDDEDEDGDDEAGLPLDLNQEGSPEGSNIQINRKSLDVNGSARSMRRSVDFESGRRLKSGDPKLRRKVSETSARRNSVAAVVDSPAGSQRTSPFTTVSQFGPTSVTNIKSSLTRTSVVSLNEGRVEDGENLPISMRSSNLLNNIRQARFGGDEDPLPPTPTFPSNKGKDKNSGRLAKLFGASPSQSSQSNVFNAAPEVPQRSHKSTSGRSPSMLITGVDLARSLTPKGIAAGVSNFRDMWEQLQRHVGERDQRCSGR